MEYPKTKNIEGREFELKSPWAYLDWIEKECVPSQKIIPFHSIGIGTKLVMKKDSTPNSASMIIEPAAQGGAVITEIIHGKDGMIRILATEKIHKKDKMKYVKEITKEIDFEAGLANETFINMFINVFTKEQLEEFLAADNIEILLFEGLMYLKHKNKAFRL